MARSEIGMLVLVIFLISGLEISGTTSSHIYYVTPTYNTSSCPRVNACFPLDHYLQFQHSYFKSNTTFHFFEGTHNASTSLKCSGVSNIALLSNSTDTVIDCVCSNIGFHFMNVTNARFQRITFNNCGDTVPREYNDRNDSATLSVLGAFGLYLTQIVISNSIGSGFVIDYFGEVYINNSRFENCATIIPKKKGNLLYCTNNADNMQASLSIENSHFVDNKHTGLLVILHDCRNTQSHFKNVTLKGNEGSMSYGGNMGVNVAYSYQSQIQIEDCKFERGTASVGGGLSIQIEDNTATAPVHECNGSRIRITNSNFTENVAFDGGGVYIEEEQQSLAHCNQEIRLHKCNFEGNRAIPSKAQGGVAVHIKTTRLAENLQHNRSHSITAITFEECNFFNNSMQTDVSGSAALTLEGSPYINITNCAFEHNNCTGLAVVRSNVVLNGHVTIANNNGSAGGGMYLSQCAILYMRPHTTVTIAHNRAQHAGGGIYVADYDNTSIRPACFFQFTLDIFINKPLLKTTRVYLTNNSAAFAGNQLYGGSISYCYLKTGFGVLKDPFKYYSKVFWYKPRGPSYISSNPQRVCYCELEDTVDCKRKFYMPKSRYPGEKFNVSLAVVGQKSGIRPGGVSAEVKASGLQVASLGELQNIQSIKNSSCAQLQYTIYSKAELVTLVLQVEQPGDSSTVSNIREYNHMNVAIRMLDCPMGFQKQYLPPFGYFCNCAQILLSHKINCNITQRTIQRQDQMWIGYADYHDPNGNHTSVVFHSTCPKDYCKPGAINITSDETLDQDEQCAFNRTGIMCGSCERNLSAVFGSSNCLECTNLSLFLILAFAFAGILLVVVLFALNLTVAEGTIHGLLFYANIVQVNASTFFPSMHSNVYFDFLKTFIAWINLDLGIETCFYNGMDALAKALLQFAFPFYIWSISGVIIFLSSRSFRVSKLIGNNAVKVLATLILLSYAKLLRAVLHGLTFVTLEFNDANVSFKDRAVWELDGNVPFTDKKYLVLYATALAFGLIMLPFTLTLLFIQPLQRHSHRRLCCHIRRLMPFFDAYTGAYKHRNRFWPGMLLSTRVILFIIHAVNLSSDPKLNMMTITLATIILLPVPWLRRRGIYRKLPLDILEALSIINLGILCSVTAYNFSAGTRRSQTICAAISVSIALLTFTGVVCFHILKQVMRTHYWERIRTATMTTRPVNEHININDDIASYPPLRRFDEEHEPLLRSTD